MNARICTARLVTRTLREGARGKDVERLQIRLTEMGFFNGDIDGVYGYLTKSAVEELQRVYRLRVDGIVGQRTWRLVNSRQLPINREIHVVQPGETLKRIAEQYGTTTAALLRANRLRKRRGRNLLPGQRVAVMERNLLQVGCGLLETQVPTALFGLRTGSVIEVGDDGGLLGPHEGQQGSMCLIKLSPALGFLGSKKTRTEVAKRLKTAVAGLDCRNILIIIPEFKGPLGTRLIIFLAELRKELGTGRRLYLAVPLVPGKNPSRPPQFILDPRTFMQFVDFVIPMLWRDQTDRVIPESIAPLHLIRQTVLWLLKYVPPWQVLLGIPGFCVRWNLTKMTRDIVPYSVVGRTLSAFASSPEWDVEEASPRFNCRRRHEDYEYRFENAASVKVKACLADRYNLAGIAIFDAAWADPFIGEAIRDVYKIRED